MPRRASARPLNASCSAQTTVQVQDAVVCKLIGSEKNGRVGHLGRIRDPVERSVF